MDARHTLKCDIYLFNRLRNRCNRYATFQQLYGFSISIGNSSGNATEPWILVQTQKANEWYQQNSHKWETWPPLTVELPVTSDRIGIELVFKSLNCFKKRLFHSATILLLLHRYLLFETSPGWLPGWRVFSLDLVGEHSAPMYLLFAPYTDL